MQQQVEKHLQEPIGVETTPFVTWGESDWERRRGRIIDMRDGKIVVLDDEGQQHMLDPNSVNPEDMRTNTQQAMIVDQGIRLFAKSPTAAVEFLRQHKISESIIDRVFRNKQVRPIL